MSTFVCYALVFLLGGFIGGLIVVLMLLFWALVWGDETKNDHQSNTLYSAASDPSVHQTNLTYH
jgi:hypothetical protein